MRPNSTLALVNSAGAPLALPTPDGPFDQSTCRQLMQAGSKTFFAASLLLPAAVRAPATALYAFCRVADDAIDLRDPSEPVEDVLGQLQHRLNRIYAGAPLPYEADAALAAVVDHFDIPQPLLDALLEGFGWDAQGRRYETLDELHDYAARVAGTVGAMMALIMRTRSPSALARACELGAAMQLTNIARDVGEDARNGRLYLPRAWLRETGIDPDAWLAQPVFNEALGAVIARLLAAADDLYQRAEHGIAELPRNCRPAIRAARLVYAEIGRAVERDGHDSVARRAVVTHQRKLALITQSLGAALVLPVRLEDSPVDVLPAVQFLIDAVSDAPHRVERAPGKEPNFYGRTLRIIDLFERVAERNRDRSLTRLSSG
jgi:phytoene synthase